VGGSNATLKVGSGVWVEGYGYGMMVSVGDEGRNRQQRERPWMPFKWISIKPALERIKSQVDPEKEQLSLGRFLDNDAHDSLQVLFRALKRGSHDDERSVRMCVSQGHCSRR